VVSVHGAFQVCTKVCISRRRGSHLQPVRLQMIPFYLKLDKKRSSRANFKVKVIELLDTDTALGFEFEGHCFLQLLYYI
jgi:hypothetical protein